MLMKIVDQRFVGFLLLVYGCEVFFDASHTCVTTLLTVIYLIHRVYESNKAERLELAKIINTTELRRGKDGCYYTFEVVPWRDPPANYKFITSFFITVLKQDENRKTPPKALRCGFIFVKDPSAIKGVLRYACEGSDFPEDTHKILAE
jgi:hypothetical protein